jgi:hypothetical protein
MPSPDVCCWGMNGPSSDAARDIAAYGIVRFFPWKTGAITPCIADTSHKFRAKQRRLRGVVSGQTAPSGIGCVHVCRTPCIARAAHAAARNYPLSRLNFDEAAHDWRVL